MVGLINDGLNTYSVDEKGNRILAAAESGEFSMNGRKFYSFNKGILEISASPEVLEKIVQSYGGEYTFEEPKTITLPVPVIGPAHIPGVTEIKLLKTDNPVYVLSKPSVTESLYAKIKKLWK